MEEGKERKRAEGGGQSQRQGSEKACLLIGHLGEPAHQQRLPRETLFIICFKLVFTKLPTNLWPIQP